MRGITQADDNNSNMQKVTSATCICYKESQIHKLTVRFFSRNVIKCFHHNKIFECVPSLDGI